ncbi:PREDICTED: uncharacterized protein F54H12.2-like [Gavialis gangeticus]|uniref:uncharacterized protein F54H12.2-like n=1 Tax=Gavialis gangeticus TaxID=94835 RepID=UPI00092ECB0A|nr:PREDICTED: uncharacterized protein F54H12.2-like [Gavialis gangeticus]
MHHDQAFRKVRLKSKDNSYGFYTHGELAYILGMLPGVSAKKTPFLADVTGGFNLLYVYTDIVEHQLVGEFSVPLLRCVPIRGANNEFVTITYDNPHYVPISQHYIDKISIEIKTDQNKHVSFHFAPTQTCIEKSLYVEIPRLSAITKSSPLDVFIPGNGKDYMDLNNTLLYLCCKIVKGNGTDLDAGAAVGLVNFPLASVFSQLDVILGDGLISQNNNCYPYRAFIESVLNYSNDTLATQFSASLFYKDTQGHHEMVAQDGDNQGFRRWANLTDRSKKIELLGHLHSDLFFQEKQLLNGMDVKIKLTRSKDAFCLMGTTAAGPCKLKITSASLSMKKVKVAPGIQLGHMEALLMANAKYPIDRMGMKVFSIPAGSCVSNQENLFLGQLLKLIVIWFVDNDAFSRNYAKNPFNFKHYNINFVGLYVDGEKTPTKPLQPDFKNGKCATKYMQLVQAAGKHTKDRALVINHEEFALGYTLFAFDLSPDQECADHYSLIKTGNLKAEIGFAAALPTTVNKIVYGVFDNVIEINQRRNVLF